MNTETIVPPKSKGLKVPAIISAAVLLIIGCGGVLLVRAERQVNKVADNAEPKSVAVTAGRASTFRATKHYVGTLEPWVHAKVGPQLAAGFVNTVLVRPGSIVKKGDVLATLDCRNASTGRQAIVHQAQALTERQKAATSEVARFAELLDGGFTSANELEQKRAQSAANEAQVQALLAQASGKSLEVNDCVLRAPFDAEVTTRLVDPGTFVRPGATMVEVVDRTVVRLTADVPEIDFEAIAPKTPARIRLLSMGKELDCVIARRSPGADPSSRTIHFEIDLANTSREIPVGTTAAITIEVGESQPAIEVPLLAAKIRGQNATVFVVEGSTAKKKTVAVVGERGGSVFLKPDVGEGALIVTQGRALLENNDRVAMKIEGQPTQGRP